MSRIDDIYNNAQVSEKSIERYLTDCVAGLGGLALKYYNANQTGYPDRLCLLPNGIVFWVELKSKNKKPTKMQLYRQKVLRDLGQNVFVCDSLEDVDQVLEYMCSK